MVLFKHDLLDPNVLQIIKNPEEIVENALIEVVLSCERKREREREREVSALGLSFRGLDIL